MNRMTAITETTVPIIIASLKLIYKKNNEFTYV